MSKKIKISEQKLRNYLFEKFKNNEIKDISIKNLLMEDKGNVSTATKVNTEQLRKFIVDFVDSSYNEKGEIKDLSRFNFDRSKLNTFIDRWQSSIKNISTAGLVNNRDVWANAANTIGNFTGWEKAKNAKPEDFKILFLDALLDDETGFLSARNWESSIFWNWIGNNIGRFEEQPGQFQPKDIDMSFNTLFKRPAALDSIKEIYAANVATRIYLENYAETNNDQRGKDYPFADFLDCYNYAEIENQEDQTRFTRITLGLDIKKINGNIIGIDSYNKITQEYPQAQQITDIDNYERGQFNKYSSTNNKLSPEQLAIKNAEIQKLNNNRSKDFHSVIAEWNLHSMYKLYQEQDTVYILIPVIVNISDSIEASFSNATLKNNFKNLNKEGLKTVTVLCGDKKHNIQNCLLSNQLNDELFFNDFILGKTIEYLGSSKVFSSKFQDYKFSVKLNDKKEDYDIQTESKNSKKENLLREFFFNFFKNKMLLKEETDDFTYMPKTDFTSTPSSSSNKSTQKYNSETIEIDHPRFTNLTPEQKLEVKKVMMDIIIQSVQTQYEKTKEVIKNSDPSLRLDILVREFQEMYNEIIEKYLNQIESEALENYNARLERQKNKNDSNSKMIASSDITSLKALFDDEADYKLSYNQLKNLKISKLLEEDETNKLYKYLNKKHISLTDFNTVINNDKENKYKNTYSDKKDSSQFNPYLGYSNTIPAIDTSEGIFNSLLSKYSAEHYEESDELGKELAETNWTSVQTMIDSAQLAALGLTLMAGTATAGTGGAGAAIPIVLNAGTSLISAQNRTKFVIFLGVLLNNLKKVKSDLSQNDMPTKSKAEVLLDEIVKEIINAKINISVAIDLNPEGRENVDLENKRFAFLDYLINYIEHIMSLEHSLIFLDCLSIIPVGFTVLKATAAWSIFKFKPRAAQAEAMTKHIVNVIEPTGAYKINPTITNDIYNTLGNKRGNYKPKKARVKSTWYQKKNEEFEIESHPEKKVLNDDGNVTDTFEVTEWELKDDVLNHQIDKNTFDKLSSAEKKIYSPTSTIKQVNLTPAQYFFHTSNLPYFLYPGKHVLKGVSRANILETSLLEQIEKHAEQTKKTYAKVDYEKSSYEWTGGEEKHTINVKKDTQISEDFFNTLGEDTKQKFLKSSQSNNYVANENTVVINNYTFKKGQKLNEIDFNLLKNANEELSKNIVYNLTFKDYIKILNDIKNGTIPIDQLKLQGNLKTAYLRLIDALDKSSTQITELDFFRAFLVYNNVPEDIITLFLKEDNIQKLIKNLQQIKVSSNNNNNLNAFLDYLITKNIIDNDDANNLKLFALLNDYLSDTPHKNPIKVYEDITFFKKFKESINNIQKPDDIYALYADLLEKQSKNLIDNIKIPKLSDFADSASDTYTVPIHFDVIGSLGFEKQRFYKGAVISGEMLDELNELVNSGRVKIRTYTTTENNITPDNLITDVDKQKNIINQIKSNRVQKIINEYLVTDNINLNVTLIPETKITGDIYNLLNDNQAKNIDIFYKVDNEDKIVTILDINVQKYYVDENNNPVSAVSKTDKSKITYKVKPSDIFTNNNIDMNISKEYQKGMKINTSEYKGIKDLDEYINKNKNNLPTGEDSVDTKHYLKISTPMEEYKKQMLLMQQNFDKSRTLFRNFDKLSLQLTSYLSPSKASTKTVINNAGAEVNSDVVNANNSTIRGALELDKVDNLLKDLTELEPSISRKIRNGKVTLPELIRLIDGLDQFQRTYELKFALILMSYLNQASYVNVNLYKLYSGLLMDTCRLDINTGNITNFADVRNHYRNLTESLKEKYKDLNVNLNSNDLFTFKLPQIDTNAISNSFAYSNTKGVFAKSSRTYFNRIRFFYKNIWAIFNDYKIGIDRITTNVNELDQFFKSVTSQETKQSEIIKDINLRTLANDVDQLNKFYVEYQRVMDQSFLFDVNGGMNLSSKRGDNFADNLSSSVFNLQSISTRNFQHMRNMIQTIAGGYNTWDNFIKSSLKDQITQLFGQSFFALFSTIQNGILNISKISIDSFAPVLKMTRNDDLVNTSYIAIKSARSGQKYLQQVNTLITTILNFNKLISTENKSILFRTLSYSGNILISCLYVLRELALLTIKYPYMSSFIKSASRYFQSSLINESLYHIESERKVMEDIIYPTLFTLSGHILSNALTGNNANAIQRSTDLIFNSNAYDAAVQKGLNTIKQLAQQLNNNNLSNNHEDLLDILSADTFVQLNPIINATEYNSLPDNVKGKYLQKDGTYYDKESFENKNEKMSFKNFSPEQKEKLIKDIINNNLFISSFSKEDYKDLYQVLIEYSKEQNGSLLKIQNTNLTQIGKNISEILLNLKIKKGRNEISPVTGINISSDNVDNITVKRTINNTSKELTLNLTDDTPVTSQAFKTFLNLNVTLIQSNDSDINTTYQEIIKECKNHNIKFAFDIDNFKKQENIATIDTFLNKLLEKLNQKSSGKLISSDHFTKEKTPYFDEKTEQIAIQEAGIGNLFFDYSNDLYENIYKDNGANKSKIEISGLKDDDKINVIDTKSIQKSQIKNLQQKLSFIDFYSNISNIPGVKSLNVDFLNDILSICYILKNSQNIDGIFDLNTFQFIIDKNQSTYLKINEILTSNNKKKINEYTDSIAAIILKKYSDLEIEGQKFESSVSDKIDQLKKKIPTIPNTTIFTKKFKEISQSIKLWLNKNVNADIFDGVANEFALLNELLSSTPDQILGYINNMFDTQIKHLNTILESIKGQYITVPADYDKLAAVIQALNLSARCMLIDDRLIDMARSKNFLMFNVKGTIPYNLSNKKDYKANDVQEKYKISYNNPFSILPMLTNGIEGIYDTGASSQKSLIISDTYRRFMDADPEINLFNAVDNNFENVMTQLLTASDRSDNNDVINKILQQIATGYDLPEEITKSIQSISKVENNTLQTINAVKEKLKNLTPSQTTQSQEVTDDGTVTPEMKQEIQNDVAQESINDDNNKEPEQQGKSSNKEIETKDVNGKRRVVKKPKKKVSVQLNNYKLKGNLLIESINQDKQHLNSAQNKMNMSDRDLNNYNNFMLYNGEVFNKIIETGYKKNYNYIFNDFWDILSSGGDINQSVQKFEEHLNTLNVFDRKYVNKFLGNDFEGLFLFLKANLKNIKKNNEYMGNIFKKLNIKPNTTDELLSNSKLFGTDQNGMLSQILSDKTGFFNYFGNNQLKNFARSGSYKNQALLKLLLNFDKFDIQNNADINTAAIDTNKEDRVNDILEIISSFVKGVNERTDNNLTNINQSIINGIQKSKFRAELNSGYLKQLKSYYEEYNSDMNLKKINLEAVNYIGSMIQVILAESNQDIINTNSYIIGVNYEPAYAAKSKVNELIILGFIENADSIKTEPDTARKLDAALKMNPGLKNIPFMYSVDISKIYDLNKNINLQFEKVELNSEKIPFKFNAYQIIDQEIDVRKRKQLLSNCFVTLKFMDQQQVEMLFKQADLTEPTV